MRNWVRYALFLAALAVSASGSAQVVMTMYSSGKITGTETLDLRPGPDGSLTQTLTIQSTSAKGIFEKMTLVSPSGEPILSTIKATRAGRTVEIQTTYGSKGVNVSFQGPDTQRSQFLPYPLGGSLKETSLFWFVRDHPTLGKTDMHTTFDPNKMAFLPTRTTYVGDENIKYKGSAVHAHKLDSIENIEWVDDNGLPYRIEGKLHRLMLVRQ